MLWVAVSRPTRGRSKQMVTGGVGGWSERPKMGGVGHVDLNGWVTGQACLLEPDNGKEIPKGRVSGSEWAPVAIYPPMHSL